MNHMKEGGVGQATRCGTSQSKRRLLRSEHIRDDSAKRAALSHTLFVRLMKRRGLEECMKYFPDDMNLTRLKMATLADLVDKYHIADDTDRERIMNAVKESQKEEQSDSCDTEVNSIDCKLLLSLLMTLVILRL